MSNRKKRLQKDEPERRVVMTEENKYEVALTLGYSLDSIDEILTTARDEGYKGVSFPIPPGR